MGRDDILGILAAHRAELEEYGVQRLTLFGPAASDEMGPDEV